MIYKWALKWGINAVALQDLFFQLGLQTAPEADKQPSEFKSETRIQNEKRLEAAEAGAILWRNNSGAAINENGAPVRFGLGNDNKKINEVFKSPDLVGIKPVLVTEDLIGQTLGVFLARECKPEGWIFKGTKRETAQLNAINKINSMHGDAKFCSGERDI